MLPGMLWLGAFVTRLHQVSGNVSAMNDTYLYIQNFNYDGTGPGEECEGVVADSLYGETYL